MTKTAFYHREGAAPHELFVLKVHADKTLDLAREESGPAIITNCAVTADPVNGSCTLDAPTATTRQDEGEPLVDPDAPEPKTKTKK